MPQLQEQFEREDKFVVPFSGVCIIADLGAISTAGKCLKRSPSGQFVV